MGANILIVADDYFIRNVICKVLRNEGYEVVEASNGVHALDLLYAQFPSQSHRREYSHTPLTRTLRLLPKSEPD